MEGYPVKGVHCFKNLERGGLRKVILIPNSFILNCSLSMLDGNGDLLEDVEGVKFVVKNHFEDSFTEPFLNRPTLEGISFKQISSYDNVALMKPFTEKEIRAECGIVMVTKVRARMVLI